MNKYIVFMLLLLSSCNYGASNKTTNSQNKIDSNLILLKKEYPFVNIDNLTLRRESNFNGEVFFSYAAEGIDTTIALTFYKKDSNIRLDSYEKKYHDDIFNYYMALESDTDTVLYYKENISSGEKIFSIGGYRYKFEKALFKDSELNYYRLYMDSLNKVRGNNLPELPELNEREKKLLEEIVEDEHRRMKSIENNN